MKHLGLGILLAAYSAATVFAYTRSVSGSSLDGPLDKPISIRQGSVDGRKRTMGRAPFIYFGSPFYRRHHGGGFSGGK
jgi:hypothetical protein